MDADRRRRDRGGARGVSGKDQPGEPYRLHAALGRARCGCGGVTAKCVGWVKRRSAHLPLDLGLYNKVGGYFEF